MEGDDNIFEDNSPDEDRLAEELPNDIEKLRKIIEQKQANLNVCFYNN